MIFESNIINILITVLPPIISSYLTFLVLRRKGITAAVDSLLNANEQFRKEIRSDLQDAKAETSMLRDLLDQSEEKYRRSLQEISDLKQLLIEYQTETAHLKAIIEQLRHEIEQLKSNK